MTAAEIISDSVRRLRMSEGRTQPEAADRFAAITAAGGVR